jgi:NAD(P)-dependent dehydrogenase (short-subunit alcohol dehydrogenase family)
VKGLYTVAHAFLKTSGGKGTLINLVSLGASFTAPGLSSYSVAKLAAIKLAEYLHLGPLFLLPRSSCLTTSAENPNLRTFSVHPGIVESSAGRGAVVDAFTPFAKDTQALTAGVTLYLQRPESDVLRGGFFSVNWDVDEVQQHKEEIAEGELLRLGFIKAKLGPEGHPWSAAA